MVGMNQRSAGCSASLHNPRHLVCYAKSHVVCFAKIIRSAVASASLQPPRCIVCFAKIITAYQRTAVITLLQNIKTTLQYLYNRHASGYERHSCALLLYSFITFLTFVFLHKYYGVISVLLPLRSS
jgi:hypothetical protein